MIDFQQIPDTFEFDSEVQFVSSKKGVALRERDARSWFNVLLKAKKNFESLDSPPGFPKKYPMTQIRISPKQKEELVQSKKKNSES